MIQLASEKMCTGCGACAFKCSKDCITMQENEIGIIYPSIDRTNCIDCHACEKVCPILNPVKSHTPQKAYAAWSLDDTERKTSASGGIAITAYKHALSLGYKAVGASQNLDFSVTLKLAEKEQELIPFKNSKYVFSDGYEVFNEIQKRLKKEEKIIAIGLPCQIAALRKIFNDNHNLLLIDIVCHGTTPTSYLKQYISHIEENTNKKAKRMSFRDPNFQTSKYHLSLYDSDNTCFHSKRTKDGDLYQLGYHGAISYRENCYNCKFACASRNGDLTFADYHGLGKIVPSSYSSENVSLILVNTKNGDFFFSELLNNHLIHADNKPLKEPISGERQLRHPSVKNKYRFFFEKAINKYKGNFVLSMLDIQKIYLKDEAKKATIYYKIINKLKKIFHKF